MGLTGDGISGEVDNAVLSTSIGTSTISTNHTQTNTAFFDVFYQTTTAVYQKLTFRENDSEFSEFTLDFKHENSPTSP